MSKFDFDFDDTDTSKNTTAHSVEVDFKTRLFQRYPMNV